MPSRMEFAVDYFGTFWVFLDPCWSLATMGLALLVPFTFGMEPAGGLIMFAGIYVGAMYADAIPAILTTRPVLQQRSQRHLIFPLAQKGKLSKH